MSSPQHTILEMVQSLERGGRTKRLVQTAQGLKNRGYDMRILTLKQPPDWVISQYLVSLSWESMPRPEGFSPVFLLKLVAYVKRNGIDAIHAHCEASYLYAGLAGFLLRIPVVGTYHRSELGFYQPSPKLKLMARLLTAVVSISTDRQSLMESNLNIPSKKITRIAGGVDFDEFKLISEAAIQVFRSENQISGTQNLLSVGHLGKIKGHDYTIQAVEQLRVKFPDLKLYIAGSGEINDQQRLEALISKYNLQQNVTLLGQRDDIHLWMQACDIFVQPSVEEGFGLVFVEAGACQKPAIGTRVGGIKDIILDHETGLLVQPENTSELATAIDELLSDPEKTRAFGRAFQQRVRENFTLKSMCDQYGQLFSKLLAG